MIDAAVGCTAWPRLARICIFIWMRTTLIIDDALLREAKHRAAERDMSVSEVVNEALREAFRASPEARPPFSMITYGPRDRSVAHLPADFAADAEQDDRSGLGR
jgi:hypothetical protein